MRFGNQKWEKNREKLIINQKTDDEVQNKEVMHPEFDLYGTALNELLEYHY
jgi:hypothetical protein